VDLHSFFTTIFLPSFDTFSTILQYNRHVYTILIILLGFENFSNQIIHYLIFIDVHTIKKGIIRIIYMIICTIINTINPQDHIHTESMKHFI
jgi:general stress protein CsbA